MKKEYRQQVYYLLALVLFIRLGFFIYSSTLGENAFFLFDSYRYLNLGANYFENGIYAEEISEPLFPSIFIPPGLPALFYFLNALGGVHLIIVFQIICQIIILIYLLKLYHLLFNNTNKYILYSLGFLYAFDIPTIVLGNVIMGETVFALFLILFIYHFIQYIDSSNFKKLILSSLFIGLSALIKPIIFYLPIILIVYLINFWRKDSKFPFLKLAYFILPFYLLTGTWIARNYFVHQKIFFSYQANFNLFYYQAASIYSQTENLPYLEARLILFEKLKDEFPPQKHFDQIEFYEKAGQKAREIIISSPHLFFKNMLKANVNLFIRPVRDYLKINWGSNELFHTRSKNNTTLINLLTYGQILLNSILTLLIPFGFLFFYKNNPKIFWFFLLLIGYFMLACSGPEIDARFRVPILPFILLLSMAGLSFIFEKIQLRKSSHQ